MGEGGIFSNSSSPSIAGSFFGHSSFAALSIVKESSVVNVTDLVKDEEELKMFSPMGCGFQTGAGTVSELAKAGEGDSVAVMGLGGVGLCAIMSAKIQGCHTIIGIDRIDERLKLAKELGATHVINTSDASVDLTAEIKKITKEVGATIVIDTTGNMGLIKQGVEFTAHFGQFIILGIPPRDGNLEIHLLSYMQVGGLRQLQGDRC
jgi:Zn-dependent alcohol dehydrogenase